MLKFIIVVLMLALFASLLSGFYFLMVDQGDSTKRRTFNSLGVRVSLAVALLSTIVYGVATGQLGRANPWDPGPFKPQQAESPTEQAPQSEPPAQPPLRDGN